VAQYALGLQHAQGDGVPKNMSDAAGWNRKAADNGHAIAQVCVVGWCKLTRVDTRVRSA